MIDVWWQGFRSGLIGIIVALALAWAALIVMLLIVRPRGGLLRESLQLLPDVFHLVRGLAADENLPRAVRIRLALLMIYLASPIDLVPDFIPIIGYADDVIITIAVLRSVIRRAGIQTVRRHWSGSDAGLQALIRLTGLGSS